MIDADLARKTCVPCRGGVPPLSSEAVRSLLPRARGWSSIDGDTKIAGEFRFKNFRRTLDFVTAIGELAEAEFHHPLSIDFGWGYCAIVLQTKKIKGLHENDFIMAAKINEIDATLVDGTESPFKQSRALRLFPTFVWKADLRPEVFQAINERIMARLGEMMRSSPRPQPGRAWQSDQDLHGLGEFGELVDRINDVGENVLDYLKIGTETFEITACWANVNAPGAAHRAHSHPNNFLSGVYYVKTQDGADTINFHDPRNQTAIIRPPVAELTADNTDQVVVNVADGTLLVFPSWLHHSVDPNRSDEERISVSFNMMFSSYSKTMSRPLWQA